MIDVVVHWLANLDADGFIILRDGARVWKDVGKATAKDLVEATHEYLLGTKAGKNFPGSMGTKIEAIVEFL